MYESLEDVKQKLVGCILFHKGRPISVIDGGFDVAGKLTVYYNKPDDPTATVFTMPLVDPDLEVRNIGARLGYINVKGWRGKAYNEALYMMRMPKRSSTHSQGLSRSNVYVLGFRGNGTPDLPPSGNLQFDESLYGKKADELSKTFLGVYPSVSEIRQEFSSDKTLVSRAFTRSWAIQKDEIGPFNLLYKAVKVGYSEDLDKFKVADRYRFHRLDLLNQGLRCA